MTEGLYLRHYLGQKPGDTSNTWTASPDIIPCGRSIVDPSWLVNEGYNTEPPSDAYLGEKNYVYVRGKNTTSNPAVSRLWLYYAPSNVVLWPQAWKYQEINIQDGNQNYTEVTSNPGQIVVPDKPFIWVPPPLSSDVGHYCLVAFAENPPLSNSQSPLPTTPFRTWDDLARFVITNPTMAWRNTIPIYDPSNQTLSAPIQGAEEGGMFSLGFHCLNMPKGSYISMQVPGPDYDNSIDIPKTPIIKPNMGLVIDVTWPPGFSSTATIRWWRGDKDPEEGAKIEPYVVTPYSRLKKRIPSLFENTSDSKMRKPIKFLLYDSPKMLKCEEMLGHSLGGIPFQFTYKK